MSIRIATGIETYQMAKYCVKMRERMNAVACNEEIWKRRVNEYQRRLREIATSLFPMLMEGASNSASSGDSEQDNTLDRSHAEKDPVMSNGPGKPADKQDRAEAS